MTHMTHMTLGLGWAGLGWAGLGWGGLGWAGLGCCSPASPLSSTRSSMIKITISLLTLSIQMMVSLE